jgi:hypothetical protein
MPEGDWEGHLTEAVDVVQHADRSQPARPVRDRKGGHEKA